MQRLTTIILLLGFVLGGSACREEGALEKAGRTVDDAVEKIQHGDEGALEKAGRKIDEAIEEAEEEAKR